jgi:hypothetical protein
MKGPWYTVEEAQEILALRYSELRYHLDNGDIFACVYTKTRHLMAVIPMAKQAPEGLATLHYNGHLTFSNKFILKLLDEGEFKLLPYCTLLEENKITNWSSEYPYEVPAPNSSVSAWYRDIQEDNEQEQYFVPRKQERKKYYIPFKEESDHAFSMLAKSFGRASSDAAKEGWSEDWKKLYQDLSEAPKVYSAGENEKWNKQDIRIAKSEIERFQSPTQIAEVIDSTEKQEGERIHLHHHLVLRIMRKKPGIAAREIWKVLQHDFHDAEIPLYDSDNIIRAIDAKEFIWESASGNVKPFLKTALPSLVSRLKQKYKL